MTCYSNPNHKCSPPSNFLDKPIDIIKTPVDIASSFVGITEEHESPKHKDEVTIKNRLYSAQAKEIPHNL